MISLVTIGLRHLMVRVLEYDQKKKLEVLTDFKETSKYGTDRTNASNH